MAHGHGHGHGNRHGAMGMAATSYERRARLIGWLVYPRVARDVGGAGLPAGARILDVGTGPGLLPVRIAGRLPEARIDAVDVDPQMIERAAENVARFGGRLTATTADVADLPFPDASFDLVVSSMSLHHWPDPAAGVRELLRVLRPGGRIWIYDVSRGLRHATEAAEAAGGAITVRPRLRPVPFDPIGRAEITRLGRTPDQAR